MLWAVFFIVVKKMAQRRMLSRRISQSKKVNKLPIKSQLIWTWTLPYLDDYGCYSGDPEDIKTEVFPKNKKVTIKDIEKALGEEAEAGLIYWYSMGNGELCQQYRNFDTFQTFKTDRDRHSNYPCFEPENEGCIPVGNHGIPKDSIKLSKVKLSKVNLIKLKYHDNVYLLESEYSKLVSKLGKTETENWIEKLNNYIGSKGKKYKSHYHTILVWAAKEDKHASKKQKLLPIPGKVCGHKACGLPAVYKDSGGSYDHWFCTDHMPENVKERYE